MGTGIRLSKAPKPLNKIHKWSSESARKTLSRLNKCWSWLESPACGWRAKQKAAGAILFPPHPVTHQSVGMFVSLNTQQTPLFLGLSVTRCLRKHLRTAGVWVCGRRSGADGGGSSLLLSLTGHFFGTLNLLIWAPVYISVPAAAHVCSETSTRGRPRFKVDAATLTMFKISPLMFFVGFYCCLESSKCLFSNCHMCCSTPPIDLEATRSQYCTRTLRNSSWMRRQRSLVVYFLFVQSGSNLSSPPRPRTLRLPLLIDCTAGQKNWGHPLRTHHFES